ncbi:MAG TPA: alkaline phosphatase family protein, partial [Solirubrobacteraceae bacterium]
SSSTPSTLPPVKHMFVIMLSDQGYDQTFGAPSSDPYLAKTLRKEGELLPNYYAVAQGELANEIALVSGQGPTPQTAADCPSFTDLEPAVAGSEGQDIGSGCVYPAKTLTLADQLTSAGKTWKSYVEGIGNGPHGQATTCRHPALGSADPGQPASLYDPYVTWRNPFVYFASLANAACGKGDVGLGQLATDLKAAKTTPNFSYIVPSPCDDGSEEPCVPGAQSGLAAADRFLRGVVPEIEASPAYRDGGMIAITFDQASQSGPDADSSSCCDNPTQYPNLPATTTTPTTTTPTTTTPTTTTPAATTPAATTPASELTGQTTPTGGGGEVGLLLISQYVKPGSVDSLDYFNHYSLLSSIEKLFGLKGLGYATDPALPSFGKPQYNDYAPS